MPCMKIALCVWRDLVLGSIAEVLGSIAEVLGSIAEVLGSIASRTLSVSRTGIEGRRNVVTLTQIAIIAKVFRFNSWTEFSWATPRGPDDARSPSFFMYTSIIVISHTTNVNANENLRYGVHLVELSCRLQWGCSTYEMRKQEETCYEQHRNNKLRKLAKVLLISSKGDMLVTQPVDFARYRLIFDTSIPNP